MRGAHRGVWCSKAQHLIEAELFAAERRRPAPSGRALLCAANYAREIQGITASQNLPDARNRAPVTPVSLHISDVSAQRRVWGSQEGAREPYGALAPFCPSPWVRRTPPVNTGSPDRRAAAIPLRRGHGVPPPPGGGNAQPCHGEYPPAREGLSRLRRQAAGTAEPLTLC